MAKKTTHGGKRRNAGNKPKDEGDKLSYVFPKGVKIENKYVKKIGKSVIKITAEIAGQKAVDELKAKTKI